MNEAQYLQIAAKTRLEGLTLAETITAKRWLSTHYEQFDNVAFQVHLGSVVDIGPQYGDEWRRQAALSSQRRADIVGYNADGVTIVEVKERIGLDALGQALGYAALWAAENPDRPKVTSVVIGSALSPDAAELLQAHGIHVELYPSPLTSDLIA